MENITSLYALLGVSQFCSDAELRTAWRQQLFKHHPDRNPEDVAATARSQQLNAAYDALTEHRQQQTSTATIPSSSRQRAWNEMDEFEPSTTLAEVAARKASFRAAWNAFRASPRDVMRALAFIHAAVDMERIDAVVNLLGNSVLIDAAPLLLQMVETSAALRTLIEWSDHLLAAQRYLEALEILEDCLAVPMPSYTLLELKDKLRSRYYSLAQGYYAPDKRKPAPDVRITYLVRILDLGFELAYVYKFLAEAYLDKGDLDTARKHLEHGFALDSQLSAVKLAKALDINPPQRQRSSARRDPRLPSDVALLGGVSRKTSPATINEVRNWLASGSWEPLLALAIRPEYGSRDREVMRLVASALGRCPDIQAAQQSLLELARSVYWEVRRAAYAALSEIGDASALEALHQAKTIDPNYLGLPACIDYIECRVDPKRIGADRATKAEAFAQGQQALKSRRFGLARFWLQQALHTASASENNDRAVIPASDHFEPVFMLAQACAEMGDTDQALQLMAPLLDRSSKKAGAHVKRTIADWLWSELVFARYDPANDDRYIMALTIHVDMALHAKNPDDLLHWIRYLTRWLEHLGTEELIVWVRKQVRDAAPGYGEVERGMGYGRNIQGLQPSERIASALSTLESQIRSGLPPHLHAVFGTTLAIKGKTHLLEE